MTAASTDCTNMIHIETWQNEFAPSPQRWSACLGEYDQGKHVATGTTEREAVNELLDYHEQSDGNISCTS